MTGNRKNAALSPNAPPTPPSAVWLKPRSRGGNQRATPPLIATYTAAPAIPLAARQNSSCAALWLVAKPTMVAATSNTPIEVIERLPHLSEATPHGIWNSAYE